MTSAHTNPVPSEGKNLEERLIKITNTLLVKSYVGKQIEKLERIERELEQLHISYEENRKSYEELPDLSEEYADVIKALKKYKGKLEQHYK
jgi:predicted RNA-binding protein with EMAP domain